MADMNISVASYSFHGMINAGEMDVFSYFDILKYRYHVGWADIWTEGCLKSLDDDYLKKVRRAMDERELKLANLCVDGPYVWCRDPEERAAHKASMLQYLRAAEILGAKTVRIDFGFGDEGIKNAFNGKAKTAEDYYTMTDEAFEYLVDTYKEYCGIVSAWGAKIGPENHWGWDRVPAYLMKVHEAVNDPAYGHLYHLRNFFDNAEEGEAFCIKNAMHTHIHANSVPYAIDVVRKLAAEEYTGTYGIEHHSGKLEPVRVEWQLASLREIIAEVQEERAGGEPVSEAFMNKVYSGVPRL